jgi:hypothetical protein
MSLRRFDYRAPKTIEEAVALRQEFGEDVLVMAGGLTAIILLRERLVNHGSSSAGPTLQRCGASTRAGGFASVA